MINISKCLYHSFRPKNFLSHSLNHAVLFQNTKFFSTSLKPTGTGIPLNMGLDHIGIVVPNVEQAKSFLMEVFDAEFDWEKKREPHPNFGENGWDKIFGVHPESYLKHVLMLKCGENEMTQYVELFEWGGPEQKKPEGPNGWFNFNDLGNSYISFTVKDLSKVMKHIEEKVFPKWKGTRFIQNPAMEFPLRGEICSSTFLVSPWGMWIELTSWSKSKEKAKVIKAQRIEEVHPLIGKNIEHVPTPSFLIDLDIVDHNVKLMKERFKEKNVKWRIPCKAHKCPDLAKYIIEKGNANGIVALTVSECENFAEAGINDIYLANKVSSKEEIKRLTTLAANKIKIRVAIDDIEYLNEIKDCILAWELLCPFEVLIELNINHNRCGCTIEEALTLCSLAKEIELKTGAVKYMGITGYEGHLVILPPEKKTIESIKSHEILSKAKFELEKRGLNPYLISAGGSCNYIDALNIGIANEIQAGGGAICDLLYYYKANLKDHGHKMAALAMSSIISVPSDNSRAMGNAGFKSLGWHPFGGLPQPRDFNNLEVIGLSAEHTKFEGSCIDGVKNKVNLKRGDKIIMYPGYTDAMGFLHREIYGIRKDVVSNVWKTFSGKTWN